MSADNATKDLDAWFLDLLACPLCDDRPGLVINAAKDRLTCANGKHSYPIKDGIPMLRPEDAEPATPTSDTDPGVANG